MTLKPILTADEASANMADIQLPMRQMEARVEANRCLYCFDAPCIHACPTGIDVPAFIRKIASGNEIGAAKTILQANILGASCARICPTKVLCEGACVLHDRDEKPIEIGRLQRHATDFVNDRKIHVLKPPAKTNGKKVAVVGSGPAGLGCAAELAQLGYAVTIFEKSKLPGGLNTYGIAFYKLKPQLSLDEAELVKDLGVEIRCGVEIGRDITGAELQRDFQAVFLGLGLGNGNQLGLPGENLPEVLDALDFIEQIHTDPLHEIHVGHHVVVIGGGNTAVDAATQSVRLGAKRVTMVYRRGESQMSAYEFEYEKAKHDSVHFQFDSMPIGVVDVQGHVAGIRLARTRMTADGKLEMIPGSEFTQECDMILKAVGQEKRIEMVRKIFPDLAVADNGVVARDPLTGATNIAHIFVGGDCANGGREVVNAVGEGKKAAHGIHTFLAGECATLPTQPSRVGVDGGATGCGLHNPIRAHELEEQWRANRATKNGGTSRG
ncbi:MAG: NAD(P)-dependent oxidoreductase [Planctomycetota bacterium]|nr:NAD(P)-dependent oxidoreductase [Planctomycetota bacterium]